jgi:hypothetical protein
MFNVGNVLQAPNAIRYIRTAPKFHYKIHEGKSSSPFPNRVIQFHQCENP